MKKKLRILLVWALFSLLLQFGAYSILNYQVQKLEQPAGNEPVALQLKATIPGFSLTNAQISYAKDYLAYTENGTLKIFNLKNKKIVFKKTSPTEVGNRFIYTIIRRGIFITTWEFQRIKFGVFHREKWIDRTTHGNRCYEKRTHLK